MATLSIIKEKPLDYLIQAVQEAEQGVSPQWTMGDCLERTHLLDSEKDGWSLLERLEGRALERTSEYLSHDLPFLWQARIFKGFEKRIMTSRSNKAEEELAKLLIGVVLVHKMRGEVLCIYGTGKLTMATRHRSSLVSEALDDIQGLNRQFPSVDAISQRRGIVLRTIQMQKQFPNTH